MHHQFPPTRRAERLHSTEHRYGDRLAPDILCRITTSAVQCCTQLASHHWSPCSLSSFIAWFLTPALIPPHGTDPCGLDTAKSWCKARFCGSVLLLHITSGGRCQGCSNTCRVTFTGGEWVSWIQKWWTFQMVQQCSNIFLLCPHIQNFFRLFFLSYANPIITGSNHPNNMWKQDMNNSFLTAQGERKVNISYLS